jgi:hypothetical protein
MLQNIHIKHLISICSNYVSKLAVSSVWNDDGGLKLESPSKESMLILKSSKPLNCSSATQQFFYKCRLKHSVDFWGCLSKFHVECDAHKLLKTHSIVQKPVWTYEHKTAVFSQVKQKSDFFPTGGDNRNSWYLQHVTLTYNRISPALLKCNPSMLHNVSTVSTISLRVSSSDSYVVHYIIIRTLRFYFQHTVTWWQEDSHCLVTAQ